MPALKCDTVLSPELDPLWASGCQECSQLGSGAREKIKHTHTVAAGLPGLGVEV